MDANWETGKKSRMKGEDLAVETSLLAKNQTAVRTDGELDASISPENEPVSPHGYRLILERFKSFFTASYESDWEKKTGSEWQEWGSRKMLK